jgi:DNA polymerase III epsilon subunit-like protein
MAKNLIYLDIETSGLEPSQGHCILGIGAVVEKNVKRDPISEFSALVIPTEMQWQLATPEALKVNGLTLEHLVEHGKPFNEVRDDFMRWLMEHGVQSGKYTYVGQNPSFDLKFLGSFMGPELEFINFPTDDVIDIRDLYSILVNRKKVRFLKYRSGKNISEAIGVEPEPDVHLAIEGARVVRRNYQKLVELGARS